MVAEFYADVPHLTQTRDAVSLADSDTICVWTFTGYDTTADNPLNIQGCGRMGDRTKAQGHSLARVVRRGRLRATGGRQVSVGMVE